MINANPTLATTGDHPHHAGQHRQPPPEDSKLTTLANLATPGDILGDDDVDYAGRPAGHVNDAKAAITGE
jgi:hypothetical protein